MNADDRLMNCRPGDPDPTAGTEGDGWWCGAFSPAATGAVFRCTRLAGHEGHHLAGDGTAVRATWWRIDDGSEYRPTSL